MLFSGISITVGKNHKLNEWLDFCGWIKDLPYSELITDTE